MKRPVIFVCLSTVLGILLAGYFNWVYGSIMLLLIILAICYKIKVVTWKLILVFLIFCSFGFFNTARVDWTVQKVAQNINIEETVQAKGKIEKIEFTENKYKLICKLNQISQQDRAIRSKIKVIVYVKSKDHLNIEDEVLLTGNLQSFTKPKNPGGFDSFNYYYGKKIYFSYFVEKLEVVRSHKGIKRIIGNIRTKLETQTNNIFPEVEASIINTLLLGTTDELSVTTKKLYQVSGISHLLAISGLHVSLIGMGILKLLKKIIKNEKVSVLIACGILWSYCFLSGASTSALRSTLMFSLMLLSTFFGEKYDILSSLFLSCLVILALNPYQLMDVGFLLSFCAVGGIVAVTPYLNSEFNPDSNELLSLLFVTMGASLLTYPILVYFFYQISVYSLLVNLIVVPTSSVLIGFSALALFISFLSPFIGKILAGIIYFVLKYIEMICQGVMWLPFHTFIMSKPTILAILLYYLALYLWMSIKRIHYAKMILLAILTFFMVTLLVKEIGNRDTLKITFLDVGQGDASVIEYRHRVYLVDGGGNINSTSEMNVGHYVLMPFLASQGIRTIDGIFISHSDFDHIYGIIEVMQEIPTRFIVLPEPYQNNIDELTQKLLDLAKEKGTEIIYSSRGYNFNDQELRMDCLYPEIGTDYYHNNNARSMVLKLSYKEFSLLYTGDIEEPEENLIKALSEIEADVIKVPHHGSKTSSTEEFIAAVQPQVAIFSYALHNQFGHPSSDVVQRYLEQQVDDYHIAKEGAIILLTKGETFKVEGYYSKRKEMYHATIEETD